MIKKLVPLVFLLLFFGRSNAQLVNIESKRMKVSGANSYRLNGNINFSYSNNNGTYFSNIGTGITTAFRLKDPSTIYFFTGSYNLAKSKLQDFQNSWFFHLRYNKKLGNVDNKNYGIFRLEAFLQNQNNELQTINSRNLVGAGIRYKFIDYPKRKDLFRFSHGYGINGYEITKQRCYNSCFCLGAVSDASYRFQRYASQIEHACVHSMHFLCILKQIYGVHSNETPKICICIQKRIQM